jgi:5-methylcytosine-specific restriction endonuclease McrA
VNRQPPASRSNWLAFRNAVSDPRWQTARAIKLRQEPICQLRIRCRGAGASEVVPATLTLSGASWLDPANLRSACPACQQWQMLTGTLRVHA